MDKKLSGRECKIILGKLSDNLRIVASELAQYVTKSSDKYVYWETIHRVSIVREWNQSQCFSEIMIKEMSDEKRKQ